jgi:ferric-dicitrate binding protein FerR (iron transport regulator)
MQRITQLISEFLDGELDAAAATELEGLLREDPAAVDQLVLDSFVHSQLHDWMHVRQLRDELWADALRAPELDHCALEADLAAEELELSRAHARRRWLGIVAGLAAAILVAASIFTAGYFASRPAIVAQLTDANNCQWESGSSPLAVGTLLRAGQPLQLKSGRAKLTFTSGAQLILDGPAAVELRTELSADLAAGRVAALVPTQAIGFAVATPIAKFVDLGTEFTLALEPNNSCELQVFDGLVELQLPSHAERASEQLRISEGSAVRFDAESFDVRSIPYDEEQRITR